MGAIRRILTWLSDSKHQKTISFWGGGLVIVVAAWQLYIHFYPAKSSAPPTQVIEPHVSDSGTFVLHTGEGDIYTGISLSDLSLVLDVPNIHLLAFNKTSKTF